MTLSRMNQPAEGPRVLYTIFRRRASGTNGTTRASRKKSACAGRGRGRSQDGAGDSKGSAAWSGCGARVKIQRGAAGDELDVGVVIAQQAGHIDGGRAGADYGDTAIGEVRRIGLAVTVGEQFRGKMAESFRDVREVGDADG